MGEFLSFMSESRHLMRESSTFMGESSNSIGEFKKQHNNREDEFPNNKKERSDIPLPSYNFGT